MMTCDVCGKTIARGANGRIVNAQSSALGFGNPELQPLAKQMMTEGLYDLDNDCAEKLITSMKTIKSQADAAASQIVQDGLVASKAVIAQEANAKIEP